MAEKSVRSLIFPLLPLRKTTANRSQRGPAFGGSAGASLSHVFTRLFIGFPKTSTALGPVSPTIACYTLLQEVRVHCGQWSVCFGSLARGGWCSWNLLTFTPTTLTHFPAAPPPISSVLFGVRLRPPTPDSASALFVGLNFQYSLMLLQNGSGNREAQADVRKLSIQASCGCFGV